MAKCKRSAKRPQPEHKKQKKSQHDKRKRLEHPNPDRKKTTTARVPLVGELQTAVGVLQAVMDSRIAFRLAVIVAGMMLGDGRRTCSAWFVAAGVQDDWDRFYDCLVSVGRTSGKLAAALFGLLVRKFAPKFGDRILLAMDDSPTARYGRHVEGAGVHHNPTPGPADSKWLYGHSWVALAWLAIHPAWGVVALSLRSMLYVREVDVPKLREEYGWKFRTKHQLGVELLSSSPQFANRDAATRACTGARPAASVDSRASPTAAPPGVRLAAPTPCLPGMNSLVGRKTVENRGQVVGELRGGR